MIRVIAANPLPPAEAAHGRRLADPDLLLRISERLRDGGRSDMSIADEFSHVLHDLRMGGTWKRTNRGRLQITEALIATHLAAAGEGDFAVLDLGASDGITTLELLTALRLKFGARVRITMTDLNLWLLRYRKGPVVEYRAVGGEPIMVRIGRFGLRLSGERRERGGGVDPIAALYLRCGSFRRAMRLDARIPLVQPVVANEPAIAPIELDCLVRDAELVDRFAAVRASNVLNLAYFTGPQLDQAVGNIHAYLRDAGVLVVSRNHDGPAGEVENGSIWRKADARFRHIVDFGAGSEIKATVDAWTRR